MSRWIRVDDFDRRINYSSYGWSASQVSGVTTNDYDFVNLQDAFLGTAHVVVGTDFGTQSSFSFAFNGTGVAVYGMFTGLSSVCLQDCTAAEVVLPNWACFLDGQTIPSNKPFGHFPWQSYCEKHDLEDGLHVISAQIFHRNVSLPSGFYLDFIQYLQSDSLSSELDQRYLMIDSTDPQIPFGKRWKPFGTANMTMDGGNFSFEFTGVWLAWYSLSPLAINTLDPSLLKNETLNAGVLCQYTIDGQDPISFMMAIGPDTLKPVTYNTILLQTATLPAGKHNITVSGLALEHPTTLDYIVVRQGPLISSDAAASANTSPAPLPLVSQDTQDTNSARNHPVGVGAIAGGATGGALLLVALIVCLLRRKRRKSRTTDVDSIFGIDSLPHIKLEPFRDSLEKPTTPGSENTIIVTTSLSRQAKKSHPCRLQGTTAGASTSSVNLYIPPPISPTLHNVIDPFIDPFIFKPPDAIHLTTSLNASEAQALSSSIRSQSRPLLADEPSGCHLYLRTHSCLSHNSPPPDDGSPPIPRHMRHENQNTEIAESETVEEQTEPDVLGNPQPPQRTSTSRSTSVSNERPISRVVRHADSGIRLTRGYSENILELPPEYTME